MKNIETILENVKLTQNGDLAYSTTGNKLMDILFGTEYYRNHLDQIPEIEKNTFNQYFCMFIRDPRLGLGQKLVGRHLLSRQSLTFEEILKAGRADDLLSMWEEDSPMFYTVLNFLRDQIEQGNELVKKWMPRYSSKNLLLARKIAGYWGMNKQEYGKFIKCTTTESLMSSKSYDSINFEHTPSLAAIKYAPGWAKHPELGERYSEFIKLVKEGKKSIHMSTSTPYDIYLNMKKLEDQTDIFFDQLPKISGSWVPIVDTSGSMCNKRDSIGKALALGHYLAKCSEILPDKVISFSSRPKLITLGEKPKNDRLSHIISEHPERCKSNYEKEILSMVTGDCSNTNFGAVCDILSRIEEGVPRYFIVLSDMEFDQSSSQSKEQMMSIFKKRGFDVKLIWWNLNSDDLTCPETDEYGNIFLSGYNPLILDYLKAGFNQQDFLTTLVEEYVKRLNK